MVGLLRPVEARPGEAVMSTANRIFFITCLIIFCLIGSTAVQADPMSDALAKAA